ncbi:hypothetical protein Thiowin_03845 [Thiorhodovibrio winogradskyi]|uniref:Uncharacterized protein n=1 Tax=Thiorhodovibrio winogradskyi TaxID=77007 RepID=A0ABZ0SCK8_9GAMM|nr:hypothetical protein [Thiorhodovibrio winogradskyi]
MSSPIPESDWKLFKTVREQAFNRFTTKVLEDCRALCDHDGRPPAERFDALSRLTRQRDKDIGRLFGHSSRSSATLALMVLRAEGLVDDQDVARFSPETQAASRPVGDT